MSIALGPTTLHRPVVLAPMSGVTDRPFRSLVAEFGASMVVSEMIACSGVIGRTRQSHERAELDDAHGPRVIQLAGCEPGAMAEAARLCEDLGADVIDINMGCPVKKVVRGEAGSALMRDLRLAAHIIEATVKVTKLPVTLKMRTGWDERSRNAPELARIAEAAGIHLLTVHGRTRSQFFKGKADWDFIAQVKRAVSIPVIANGDIASIADAQQVLRQSEADGLMIGRGAYGRPWFIAQVMAALGGGTSVPDPPLRVQRDTVLKHYDAMLAHYGAARGVRIARKHLNWYLDRLNVSATKRQVILRSDDPAQVRDRIDRIYGERAELSEAA